MLIRPILLASTLACSSATTPRTAYPSAAPKTTTPVEVSQGAREVPRELGRVDFSRDFEASLARAKSLGKPVFALFQEVPGCATCVAFGKGPLSHPLLVEAIEELFVPVAVYNNHPGDDREVLDRYNEPSWNNPVVRFLDTDGNDLLPRRDGVWDTNGIAVRAAAALEAAGQEVPLWFQTLVEELKAGPTERAVFAMSCFWTGEAQLGKLDGVVNTQAGWYAGREVVEVTYRPGELSQDELVSAARNLRCASRVWAPNAGEGGGSEVLALTGGVGRARESDQLHSLKRTSLRWLPLTPLQARRVNAALYDGRSPNAWLSPRQLTLAAEVRKLGRDASSRLGKLERPDEHAQLAHYSRALRRALELN